jgi:hypothetical protein
MLETMVGMENSMTKDLQSLIIQAVKDDGA